MQVSWGTDAVPALMQVEHKWRLQGVEERAAWVLKKRLKQLPLRLT